MIVSESACDPERETAFERSQHGSTLKTAGQRVVARSWFALLLLSDLRFVDHQSINERST
ncbi:hypothetical protein ACFQV8_04880 [Pseudonocardia benzenivorans]